MFIIPTSPSHDSTTMTPLMCISLSKHQLRAQVTYMYIVCAYLDYLRFCVRNLLLLGGLSIILCSSVSFHPMVLHVIKSRDVVLFHYVYVKQHAYSKSIQH